MLKALSIMKPSRLLPMPMMMCRSAWAQKSMIQPISTRRGSMFSRVRPRLARNLSPRLNSCCIREVTATIARLWAFMIALMSPVRPRLNSVSGMTCESPPPAADPLTFIVGPPEG